MFFRLKDLEILAFCFKRSRSVVVVLVHVYEGMKRSNGLVLPLFFVGI